MWFITGGAALVTALCKAFGYGDSWLADQMCHVPWEGLAHHDTIFPLFLFLAGVSWPFSHAAQVAKGRTALQIHRKVIVRALVLFGIGVALGGFLKFSPHFRIPSVLGYIGLSWGVAAILFIHVKRLWGRLALVAALLVGYWALLAFTLAPDAAEGAGHFLKNGNIVSWLDRALMPNHILLVGKFDPESLFSLPGGVAMALMGMLAGTVLKGGLRPWRKVGALAGMGAILLAVDLVFIYVMGDVIVKRLWTSSFVLSAATYSVFMLALFYMIVDVLGWTRWAFYFKVIGMNSITVYLLQWIVGFKQANGTLFGGLAGYVGGSWGTVVSSVGYLAVVWVTLYFLYRRQIFLKV